MFNVDSNHLLLLYNVKNENVSICDNGIAIHSVQIDSSPRLLPRDTHLRVAVCVDEPVDSRCRVCIFVLGVVFFFWGGGCGMRKGRFISLLFINSTNSIRSAKFLSIVKSSAQCQGASLKTKAAKLVLVYAL